MRPSSSPDRESSRPECAPPFANTRSDPQWGTHFERGLRGCRSYFRYIAQPVRRLATRSEDLTYSSLSGLVRGSENPGADISSLARIESIQAPRSPSYTSRSLERRFSTLQRLPEHRLPSVQTDLDIRRSRTPAEAVIPSASLTRPC